MLESKQRMLKLFKVALYSNSIHYLPRAMLEFWFNPKVAVWHKLAFFILLGAITFALYWYQPLSLDAILMFLGTGIIFLICRYCKIHFTKNNTTGLLYRVLTWIPIALILALIFMHMKNGEILIPGAQGLGFMALGICLFSPLSLLNSNSPPEIKK